MEARRLSRTIGDGQMTRVLRLIVLLVARSSNFLPNPRHRISGKTSTLREPLRESKEARRPGVELSSRESQPGVDSSSRPVSLSVEDTFKENLNKAKEGSGTLESRLCCRLFQIWTRRQVCARSLVDFSDRRSSCTS